MSQPKHRVVLSNLDGFVISCWEVGGVEKKLQYILGLFWWGPEKCVINVWFLVKRKLKKNTLEILTEIKLMMGGKSYFEQMLEGKCTQISYCSQRV